MIKQDIIINIAGEIRAGKTTFGIILYNYLKSLGLNVTLQDSVVRTKRVLESVTKIDLENLDLTRQRIVIKS